MAGVRVATTLVVEVRDGILVGVRLATALTVGVDDGIIVGVTVTAALVVGVDDRILVGASVVTAPDTEAGDEASVGASAGVEQAATLNAKISHSAIRKCLRVMNPRQTRNLDRTLPDTSVSFGSRQKGS